MLDTLITALKIRTLVIFLLIHVGLCLGIFALARIAYPEGWNLTSSLMILSLLGLYGGFLASILFILIPLIPLLRRAQRVEHWSEKWIGGLPYLIEQTPRMIEAAQNFMKEWRAAQDKAQTNQPSKPSPPAT